MALAVDSVHVGNHQEPAADQVLRDHLRGGKVKGATDEDIARISTETGWGVTAVQAAVTTILREDRARKRPDQSPA